MAEILDVARITVALADGHPDVPFLVVAQAVQLAAIGAAASTGETPTPAAVTELARTRLAAWRRHHPASA